MIWSSPLATFESSSFLKRSGFGDGRSRRKPRAEEICDHCLTNAAISEQGKTHLIHLGIVRAAPKHPIVAVYSCKVLAKRSSIDFRAIVSSSKLQDGHDTASNKILPVFIDALLF